MDKDSALFPVIPASTIRAARAHYGRGNLYLRLGDRLNHLTSTFGPRLTAMRPSERQTALFVLLTIIQYVEKLTDAELAEAIEQRMELRYALHLPTPSHRLDPHALCAFRTRVLTSPDWRSLFEEMFRTIYPEITSTAMKDEPNIEEVLHSICARDVHATLVEAMLRSMETLSANHFNWLREIALPHWYQRYNRSLMVLHSAGSLRKQELSLEEIQADIEHLLGEIHSSNLHDLMEMPETKNLALIREQLTDPAFMRDCQHCIHAVH